MNGLGQVSDQARKAIVGKFWGTRWQLRDKRSRQLRLEKAFHLNPIDDNDAHADKEGDH